MLVTKQLTVASDFPGIYFSPYYVIQWLLSVYGCHHASKYILYSQKKETHNDLSKFEGE